MSRVLFCGFKPISYIENYFRAPILEKGEKLYVAGHVYDVKETDGTDLRAKCHSQQRKEVYDVSLQLTRPGREISAGRCSCRYGARGDCKHCAALAIFVVRYEDRSSTTGPKCWGVPSKKPRIDDKMSIEDLFGGGTKKGECALHARSRTRFFGPESLPRNWQMHSCVLHDFLLQPHPMVYRWSQ
ncbi:uncharacterized protein LOC119457939 isoform X2 [Dermacentor silvarum]|uniref:uncharacterized protein LOC119457939 isoform X2 n=1 Tax=Dermacentor silvarum TaxID=543639 RepID=UPI0021008F69|nr:uncharacterized protein LOC119457939 isoform X2 [Dermacentor silvarum]